MEEDILLKPYTTFALGGAARYLMRIHTAKDLEKLPQMIKKFGLPVRILGGGSNIVVSDKPLEAIVVKMEITGRRITETSIEGVFLEIGAGENWDDLVSWTVQQSLSGLEALSAIPGTVGAAPVQNIGAYGQEFANVCVSVTAFDLVKRQFVALTKDECQFAYRDSIFKHHPGIYIITSVCIRLSKDPPQLPAYPGVQEYFENTGMPPTLENIRAAIIAIRAQKLPDPKIVPNVGSFFHNPIVSSEMADTIAQNYPAMPRFAVGADRVKIPAGWLIEQAGYKGKELGPIRVSPDNAVVLQNIDNATMSDVEVVVKEIQTGVKKKFDIDLTPEPEFWN